MSSSARPEWGVPLCRRKRHADTAASLTESLLSPGMHVASRAQRGSSFGLQTTQSFAQNLGGRGMSGCCGVIVPPQGFFTLEDDGTALLLCLQSIKRAHVWAVVDSAVREVDCYAD